MVDHVGERVVLYTSDHCKKSDLLRDLFEQWGVNFEERNTTKNRMFLKELQQQGIFGTPTTFIGDTCIEGVQKNRLYNLLKN